MYRICKIGKQEKKLCSEFTTSPKKRWCITFYISAIYRLYICRNGQCDIRVFIMTSYIVVSKMTIEYWYCLTLSIFWIGIKRIYLQYMCSSYNMFQKRDSVIFNTAYWFYIFRVNVIFHVVYVGTITVPLSVLIQESDC